MYDDVILLNLFLCPNIVPTMGQCASKSNEEKSCEVGVGGSSSIGINSISDQAEEEDIMSPEELKSHRQMVERRKDSFQVQRINQLE